ncbi:unnamed protein product [Withania somnifera]
MATAAKDIVTELNKGDKLNGDNYEIWSMKIHYVTEDQEALEALNLSMTLPENGDTPQHYDDAKDMWSALIENFGHTSVAKLRDFTIKFDTFKKSPNHTMCKHLGHMPTIVNELKDVGYVLIDK